MKKVYKKSLENGQVYTNEIKAELKTAMSSGIKKVLKVDSRPNFLVQKSIFENDTEIVEVFSDVGSHWELERLILKQN